MALRPSRSRFPFAAPLLIALSVACGGGGDSEDPTQYEDVPGPNVPQAPAERRQSADGECTITTGGGAATSVSILSKVEETAYAGRETGFHLEMACGDTIPDVVVSLYFAHGSEILRVERKANRWTVNGRSAEAVPPQSEPKDAGALDASDAGDAADASADDARNGIGLPATDGSRRVVLSLVAGDVRYDIRATIPWRASIAPATCQQVKPGTGTKSSSGGCGGGSSSRKRSSGGDWD